MDATLLADAAPPDAVPRPDGQTSARDAAEVPEAGMLPDASVSVDAAEDAGISDAGLNEPDLGFEDAGPEDATPLVDAGNADAGVCPTLPAPVADVDPFTTSLPSVGQPVTRTVQVGPHTDLYLSGPQGVAELGVRLDWGGSVVFFGQTGVPASNVIDANDTGRELQIALYDPDRVAQGCAFDASCRMSTPCPNSITFLGWNPVQGGDECNHGARILSSGVIGDAMVVDVRPLQWNPDWDAADCRRSACAASGTEVEVTYRLAFRFIDPHVVEISMSLLSDEDISHAETVQEFPTLYVGHGGPSTDLPDLVDASGNRIAIDVPANDGFTMKNFTSAEPWVSFQHPARDYGVGLATDNGVRDFQGWNGDGVRSAYFHNVRPIQSFGIPAHSVVRGRSYLALGAYDTVGAALRSVLAQRPPFGFLDTPAPQSGSSGGTLHLAGWVLDNDPGTTLHATLNGVDLGPIPVGVNRPDVCLIYPGYPQCPWVGFAADFPLEPSPCPRFLELKARDADGNETRLAQRIID